MQGFEQKNDFLDHFGALGPTKPITPRGVPRGVIY